MAGWRTFLEQQRAIGVGKLAGAGTGAERAGPGGDNSLRPARPCDEGAAIFLAGLYRAEQVIAERMLLLVNGKLPWPDIDPEKALPWIEQKTGFCVAERPRA